MKAVSVLEHFSDHGSIHQKMKKNTTSVRSYPNSADIKADVRGDIRKLSAVFTVGLRERAANTLVRLVEGKERLEASDHPQSVVPLNCGGIEPNRTVTCMVLKAMANDRRHLALCPDEFRGPRSGLCHSVAFSERSSTQRLIEDETIIDSDFINNLMNYEDGQEARFFERG
ncbi:uncharacterized protein TNCV_1910121 [Trichonephila clavipes]|nr:uncharacterized protein TNCV_1910121 [Trichonephila clavipes]